MGKRTTFADIPETQNACIRTFFGSRKKGNYQDMWIFKTAPTRAKLYISAYVKEWGNGDTILYGFEDKKFNIDSCPEIVVAPETPVGVPDPSD